MNMILVDSMNNINTRRKDSMLQRLTKIKYFIVLVVLLALPMLVLPTQAIAGQSINGPGGVGQRLLDQTDMGAFRLVYFVDTRDRDTFIQITNTTSRGVNIHVQLFDVNDPVQACFECNFDDMLTPQDTHVYDVKDMMKNQGPGLPGPVSECGLLDDHYGFVVISFSSFKDDDPIGGGPLIGMFRVIDGSGYEYRTNAAGKEVLRGGFHHVGSDEEILSGRHGNNWDQLINFELADGNTLSDLIGITFFETAHDKVDASPLVGTSFGFFENIEIYRENETMNSCPFTVFTCAEGSLDKAVDNSLPNSKGENNRICATSRLPDNKAGWLHMPFSGFSCAPPFGDILNQCVFGIEDDAFFVGFIGLNDGDGSGSMDSWWSQRPEDRRKHHGGSK
jgi:hypothetical protein